MISMKSSSKSARCTGHVRDQTSPAAAPRRDRLASDAGPMTREQRCASTLTCADGFRKSSGVPDTVNSRPGLRLVRPLRGQTWDDAGSAPPFNRSDFQHSSSNDSEQPHGGREGARALVFRAGVYITPHLSEVIRCAVRYIKCQGSTG